MTIRVVQGLININDTREVRNGSGPSNGGNPSTTQTQNQIVQSSLTESVVVSNRSAKPTDAAHSSISAFRGERSDKIKDPDHAQQVAEDVAERIEEDEETAEAAHLTLTASKSRRHFD